jgi:hypothetical protein
MKCKYVELNSDYVYPYRNQVTQMAPSYVLFSVNHVSLADSISYKI